MAHTPGPWTTKPGIFWVCNVGNNVDDPGVWSEYPVKDGESYPFGDKADDARLIAAAPDLLASCRSLIEAIELIGRDHAVWWPHDGDLVVRARAAIAKATGGAS